MDTFADAMEAGKRHFLAREFPQASEALRAAVRLDPSSPEAWRALGFALKENGDSANAIGAFNELIKLDPTSPDAHVGLGQVHAEMGDMSGAIREYEKALALKPNHGRATAALVFALVKHGQLRLLSGDVKGGEPSLQRAFATMPHLPEVLQPWVDHLINQKRYKEAIDAVEKSRKAAPQDPKVKEIHDYVLRDPRVERAKRENSLSGI